MKRQLKELYLFSILFSFAQALVTIFEPVFFYHEGYSLAAIALYYAIHYSVYAFLLPYGGKFAARFGLETSLAVSTPLFVIYFITLAALPQWHGVWWIALGLLTIHKIFYWPAFEATFAHYGNQKESGRNLSWMYFAIYGVGIIAPLLGGLIITELGFPTLFVMAAALALVASFPLLRTKERFQVASFTYTTPWRLMKERRQHGMVAAMLGMGEELVHLILWPVFIFIVVGTASGLGLIATVATLVATLVGFIIGKLSDRTSRRALLRVLIPFTALSFLFRPFALTPFTVLLTDTLGRMTNIGVRIPMKALMYGFARQRGALAYLVAAEIMLAIAKAAFAWVLVIIFTQLLPFEAFTLAFGLSSLLVFFYWFL